MFHGLPNKYLLGIVKSDVGNSLTLYSHDAHTDMVHEWPKLWYWSPVQILCNHQINYLRQNLFLKFSVFYANAD